MFIASNRFLAWHVSQQREGTFKYLITFGVNGSPQREQLISFITLYSEWIRLHPSI